MISPTPWLWFADPTLKTNELEYNVTTIQINKLHLRLSQSTQNEVPLQRRAVWSVMLASGGNREVRPNLNST